LFGASIFGQAPDNDKILVAVIDGDSPYYYPSLMERYERGDTTLTLDDYHYLYYGFAFSEDYRPLEPISSTDRILAVFDSTPDPKNAEAERILMFAKETMKHDPFSPRNINFMTYAYGMIGDTLNERISADRLYKVLATISSSGDGLKEESPMHVLLSSHADDVVAAKGYNVKRHIVVSSSVEFIDIEENPDKIKGFYFDYSRMYMKRPDNMPEKRVQGIKPGRVGPPKY
jgi:hypothetical protein